MDMDEEDEMVIGSPRFSSVESMQGSAVGKKSNRSGGGMFPRRNVDTIKEDPTYVVIYTHKKLN